MASFVGFMKRSRILQHINRHPHVKFINTHHPHRDILVERIKAIPKLRYLAPTSGTYAINQPFVFKLPSGTNRKLMKLGCYGEQANFGGSSGTLNSLGVIGFFRAWKYHQNNYDFLTYNRRDLYQFEYGIKGKNYREAIDKICNTSNTTIDVTDQKDMFPLVSFWDESQGLPLENIQNESIEIHADTVSNLNQYGTTTAGTVAAPTNVKLVLYMLEFENSVHHLKYLPEHHHKMGFYLHQAKKAHLFGEINPYTHGFHRRTHLLENDKITVSHQAFVFPEEILVNNTSTTGSQVVLEPTQRINKSISARCFYVYGLTTANINYNFKTKTTATQFDYVKFLTNTDENIKEYTQNPYYAGLFSYLFEHGDSPENGLIYFSFDQDDDEGHKIGNVMDLKGEQYNFKLAVTLTAGTTTAYIMVIAQHKITVSQKGDIIVSK